MLIVGLPGTRQLRLMRRETEGPSGERPCRVSAIPSERHLFGIISELRRLNRSIALPLERDLKRAGCPPLERCEVLRVSSSGATYALTASQWNLRNPPLWPFSVSPMQATAHSF